MLCVIIIIITIITISFHVSINSIMNVVIITTCGGMPNDLRAASLRSEARVSSGLRMWYLVIIVVTLL